MLYMRALAGASRSLGLRLDMYVLHSINGVKDFGFRMFPDPREDLKSRSPNSGPYTFQKNSIGAPLGDRLLDLPGGLGRWEA